MMITINNKASCTGCSACQNACPFNAISLHPDNEGFCYPTVDISKCTSCGLCSKICPINLTCKTNSKPKTFAAISKNTAVLQSSSSGGIFYHLASEIILRGGLVFGVAMTDELTAVHVEIESSEDLHRIMGSKYVQSELNATYSRIKELLNTGRLVMFAGTPCQVEGLISFLGRKYESLITVDFICHGVPSPKVLRKYISHLEKTHKKKICGISFRSKRISWKEFSFEARFDDNSMFSEVFIENLYLKAFINNLILRPSCHQCRFKSNSHSSDITLADFWGIQFIFPNLSYDEGVSLCCINSKSGEQLFNFINESLIIYPVSFEDAMMYNSAYSESSPINRMRSWFFSHLDKKTINKNIEQSLNPNLFIRLLLKISRRKYEPNRWN